MGMKNRTFDRESGLASLVSRFLVLSLALYVVSHVTAAYAQDEARIKARQVKRQADKLLKAKELDRAVEAYRRAIDLWPQYAAAHNGLGKALFKKKDYKGAEQAYATAIAYDPAFAVAHYNLAFVRRKLKKYKEAEEEYRKYIKLSPRDPDGYYGLAVSLEKQDKYAEAAKFYEKYAQVEKRPSEKKWVEKALKKAKELEKKTEAGAGKETPLITGSTKQEPAPSARPTEHAPPSRSRAPAKEASTQVEKKPGKKQVTRVGTRPIKSKEDLKAQAEKFKAQGDSLRKAGKLGQAKENYLKAIELWPELAGAHNELGLLYYKEGDFENAKKEYTAAIRSDPSYSLGHFNLGFILKKIGDYAGAEKAYKDYMRLKPNDPDGCFGLATVLEKLGKDLEAADMYERYARLETRPSAKKWIEKAKKKAEKLRAKAGAGQKQAAVTIRPRVPAVGGNGGRRLEDVLRFDLASKRLDDPSSPFARIEDPEDERFKISMGLEKEADSAVRDQDWSHAVLSYRDSLSKYPANLSARFKLAAAYARQGRMNMVVRQLAKILTYDPQHPEARAALKAVAQAPDTGADKAAAAALSKADKVSGLLERATAMCNRGDFAGAIPVLSDALGISRNCLLCQSELGRAYAGQGKVAMAAVQFTKALSVMPGIKSAIFGLAKMEAEADHKSRASKLFRLYLELEKDPAMKARIQAARKALQSMGT